jgi:ferredoxin
MDTARLRKTFKYPSDDESSDASHDEMDEQGKYQELSDTQEGTKSCPVLRLTFTRH